MTSYFFLTFIRKRYDLLSITRKMKDVLTLIQQRHTICCQHPFILCKASF